VQSTVEEAGGAVRVSGKLGPEETDGLVITCADRRFRRPVEHFLYKHLGLGNYDMVAVPGGVYMLSFAEALPKQLKVGMQMIKFLARNHRPTRIVLIAHEGCSRYREGFASWLHRPGFSLAEKQKADLLSVAQSLREVLPDTEIEAYYASRDGEDAVRFEPAA
jgi:hypothetical protein